MVDDKQDDKQSDDGVQFPLVDGRRSSQQTGRSIFAAAARYVDAAAADRIEGISNWRKDYLSVVRELVELGVRSGKNAERIATDGLDALRSRFVFERDGATTPLTDVFTLPTEHRFSTATVQGKGTRATELVIPYRGEALRGDALRNRLERWAHEGTIERSTATAAQAVADNPEWLDLSDRSFAVLGAASEMGPFPWLCRWGATVMAVDIPDKTLWTRILATAVEGTGRVLVPTRQEDAGGDLSAHAGVDLIADLPEVKQWLDTSEQPLTLGDYAYSDGALFARLAVAADALIAELLESKKATTYAYLASPTDVFAVPPEVVDAARSRRRGMAGAALRTITAKRLFAPSYRDTIRSDDGQEWGIYDCLVPQQGANYALAKTLQRWRALAARDEGALVSANVAPATKTRSVLKNKILAAAYAGAKPFGVEVFAPATSSALMSALLVHDIRTADTTKPTESEHPYKLFVEGAAHGGLWNMPYEPRSVLPLAVFLGYTRRNSTR